MKKRIMLGLLCVLLAVLLVACQDQTIVPPELVLQGEGTMKICGAVYQEPGFTATDNVDGDLTAAVKVTGQVDSYAPGTYTLTYSVTDSHGNAVTATRTVEVEKPVQGDTVTDKVIYLTFDDGPGENTERLLDILKEYNVKATFFCIGRDNMWALQRMAEEGHTVGVHTYSHKAETVYASEEAFFADLNMLQATVQLYTGQRSTYLRFPFGSHNTRSDFNPGIMTRLTQLVEEKGYRYFDWDVFSQDDTGNPDTQAKTPEEVFYNVTTGLEKRDASASVVLMHETKDYSVDAVERILMWGIANGYTFLPLDENAPDCHSTVKN